MESNRKRRGSFMKGKFVMSMYKATKPVSTAPYGSKVKPIPHPPAAGGGFIVNQQDQAKQQRVSRHDPHVEFIVNQEQVAPQPKQKVSFLLPAVDGGSCDSYEILRDSLYNVAADESVDMKAATYISSVREKLKLHRINS